MASVHRTPLGYSVQRYSVPAIGQELMINEGYEELGNTEVFPILSLSLLNQ